MRPTVFVWFAIVVTLTSCQAADPQANRGAAPVKERVAARLTAHGWGALRIGMTRAEVVATVGNDAHPEAVGGPDQEACDEFRPKGAPEGMLVMIEHDRLTRISISEGTNIETEHGFRVGDAAAEIKAAYGGRAVVAPHKYIPAPAEYITLWSSGPSASDPRGIVYEIGPDGRVKHIHAGGPSIQYVEGCL
jgi:hypothetical protein